MKKMILTALVVASTAVGLNAQNMQATTPAQGQQVRPMTPPSPEDRAKRMTDRINQVVTLTPEQLKKVTDVNVESAKKEDELRKNAQAAGGGANMRDQFKALHDDQDAKLKAILTPDQWAKWQATRSQRMNMGGKPGMAPAATPAGGNH